MLQKGITNILLSVVVAVVIIFAAIIILNSHNNNQIQSQNSSTPTPTSNPETNKNDVCQVGHDMVQVPKESTDGAFIHALTNIDSIDHIAAGNQAPDQRFTYLWIKGSQRIPIFAPADGTLIKISYKTRVDIDPNMSFPDYDLTFLVDCHTMYRINHITDPSPEIAALKPNVKPLALGVNRPAPSDEATKPKQYIKVKAGQQIGTTTGTPSAHNWDFGIFVDAQATCPYEKFNEPIRSSWLALIKGAACSSSGHF